MIIDIINKKKAGQKLTYQELTTIFNGYLNGTVPDYQMSAFLMAICLKDMTDQEVIDLTDIFVKSGERLNLDDIQGLKVDKHSTGGVGDKTTLIIAPIVASCGVKVIKMSGRSLGYTGGTIDKLESIPGFRVDLTEEEIKKQAKEIGIVDSSQTLSLVPLDKKIYALRDVTATVDSIPLIAVSIMSKKIASGNKNLVLDIKVGSGAFFKTMKEATRFATIAEKIGTAHHMKVRTIISNMDTPLGLAVGNKLEVEEAIAILKNEEQNSLTDLVLELSSNMIALAKNISIEEALQEATESLISLRAYHKFVEWITYQGGNLEQLKNNDPCIELKAEKNGKIVEIDALEIAKFVKSLGAGRFRKEDEIDYDAGIYFIKTVGDVVKEGEVLAKVYTSKKVSIEMLRQIIKII